MIVLFRGWACIGPDAPLSTPQLSRIEARTGRVLKTELTVSEEDEITTHTKKVLNDALQRADDSPLPDPSTLLDGVYATPEDLDTPHHK
jgi:TPP-dependent pyruvate/acetoin dehydrogenase alpha subunit